MTTKNSESSTGRAWGNEASLSPEDLKREEGSKRLEARQAKRHREFGPYTVLLSLVALVASFIITLEKIDLYKDPMAKASCDLNAVLSCSTVMKSTEFSEAFGFPNPLLGLIGFSLVLALGFAAIFSGKSKSFLHNRVFLALYLLGILAAQAFVTWLWFNATFVITALCIYCMIVWVAVALLTGKALTVNFRKLPRGSSLVYAVFVLAVFFLPIVFRFREQLF